MKIVYFFADPPDNIASSGWRCLIPAQALNRTGRHAARSLPLKQFSQQSPAAVEACTWADTIVVEKYLCCSTLEAAAHWKQQGKTVVVDLDSAIDLMRPDHPTYAYWMLGRKAPNGQAGDWITPAPIVQFKEGLSLIDGVTTASQRLAGDWLQHSPSQYLASYPDLRRYENIPQELKPQKTITLGWVARDTSVRTLAQSGALAALQNLCKARPYVRIAIFGKSRQAFSRFELPADRFRFIPDYSFELAPRQIAQIDIGLAPLATPYDDRRDWRDVLEYMLLRIPWIASESPAYADLRPYGWHVQNRESTWHRLLLDMVDHLDDYRCEAQREAYLFAITQGIDEHIDRVVGAYNQLSSINVPFLVESD